MKGPFNGVTFSSVALLSKLVIINAPFRDLFVQNVDCSFFRALSKLFSLALGLEVV